MESPVLLCIETSSPVCSVALARGLEILDAQQSDIPNGHSAQLTIMLYDIVQRNKLTFGDIQAIVIDSGPGSYTGLRIGMSTAKGLCYALNKPLITVTALESMVCAFLEENTVQLNDILVPMIDARRMEVYTQVFDGKGKAIDSQKPYISGKEGLISNTPEGKVWLFGSGAEKMATGLAEYDVQVVPKTYISAENLLKLGYERWLAQQFSDVAYTTPNYGKSWQKA